MSTFKISEFEIQKFSKLFFVMFIIRNNTIQSALLRITYLFRICHLENINIFE